MLGWLKRKKTPQHFAKLDGMDLPEFAPDGV